MRDPLVSGTSEVKGLVGRLGQAAVGPVLG
jgi:hypothetical protein